MTLKHIIPNLRNTYKKSRMRFALPRRILLNLYNLHKRYFSSYCFLVLVWVFASILLNDLFPVPYFDSSYFLSLFLFLGIIDGRDFSKTADFYEKLGGEGNRVAFYLRVSTRKQARDGRSIDVQREAMDQLIEREKPSVVYGYWDPGK
ncbi:MAG: hypothetical protein ACTSW1_10840, partial [Candidatus Hodarchaeales archaeon]